jgi:hypothetical protein
VGHEGAKTARDQARETTQEQLLEAGEQLIREAFETGTADPLRFLSPSEVTETASKLRGEKLSRGMLYHLWPPIVDAKGKPHPDKLAHYRKELLIRVLDLPFDPDGIDSAATDLIHKAKDQRRELALDDLVLQVGEFDFRRYAFGEPEARTFRFSTLMVIFAENAIANAPEELRDRLREEMREEMRRRGSYKDLKDMYSKLLDAFGLEMADGFTVEDLVEGLWSMLDGFTLNSWHFERVTTTRGWRGKPGWSLFSIAVYAFVDALTVPTRRRTGEPNAEQSQREANSLSSPPDGRNTT